MALKDGFKKFGNVISNTTSEVLGEDALEKLEQVKNSVQETAEEMGINDGIRKVAEKGSAGIQQGKNKLAELARDPSDNAEPSKGENTSNAKQVVDSIPNIAIMNSPTNVASNGDTGKENAYEMYSKQADQVLKLKELLDLGIITQEEFEAKKKAVLGI